MVDSGSQRCFLHFLQANAIKLALQGKDVPANVYVAMRYWHPFTEEAVHQVIH